MTLEQWWIAELALGDLFKFDELNLIQLHYITEFCDSEMLPVDSIIEHPECDFGTALLMYSRLNPNYNQRFSFKDEKNKYNEELNSIKTIIRKVENSGFKTKIFAYDPDFFGFRLERDIDRVNMWEHSEIFLKPFMGEEIEYDFERNNDIDVTEALYIGDNSFTSEMKEAFDDLKINFDGFLMDIIA